MPDKPKLLIVDDDDIARDMLSIAKPLALDKIMGIINKLWQEQTPH